MLRERHQFPPMPDVGHPETYYAKLVQRADRHGDVFAREAAKVGQYITLAMNPSLDWPSKLRYFQHALRRHCVPPNLPDEEEWVFFRNLANLVHHHAGHEALRLASAEDDQYVLLQRGGVHQDAIRDRARAFFGTLIGFDERRPDWFNEEDWSQLKLIKAQWL